MRPKRHETMGEQDLFRATRSDHRYRHELVQLAGKLDWDWLDGEIAPLYSARAGPGSGFPSSLGCCCSSTSSRYPTRRCVNVGSMTPISSTSPARSSSSAFPHERSDLSHWRKAPRREARASTGREPAGRARGQRVAHEGPQAGHGRHHRAAQAIRADRRQVAACRDPGAQSPRPQARNTAATVLSAHCEAGRDDGGALCPHKQFNRHHRQLRLLRIRLGRIIRDIRRKIAGKADLEALFEWPLTRANQIRSQQQRQRGWKLHSFHAPEVECIGKGKASAPYEFGIRPRSPPLCPRARRQFVLHAKRPGKPLRQWPHAGRRDHRRPPKAYRLRDRACLCR